MNFFGESRIFCVSYCSPIFAITIQIYLSLTTWPLNQKALEDDITIINKAFLDINSPAITNMNLSRRAQVRSKKSAKDLVPRQCTYE